MTSAEPVLTISGQRVRPVPLSVFAPPYRVLSVGILASITAIAFEGMAVPTVLPAIATSLGGLDAYGWAFSAFLLTSLLGAISAGQTGDRHGPGRPARLGLLSFGAGLLVAALAPIWPVLLLGRALQGFGAGSLMSVAYICVGRGYPEQLRPRLLALMSSAWVLPALVGPALAGQIAEHASWRWVFVCILPLLISGAVLLVRSLGQLPPATPEPSKPPLPDRLPAALRLAVGVGLVLFALGLDALLLAVPLAVGGAILAVPAFHSLLPEGTPRLKPGLPAAVGVRALLACGFFSCEALIPLGLATLRGLPPSTVGFALTAAALTWVGGSWLQDRAESRTGGRRARRTARIRAGLGLIVLGVSCVALVVLWPTAPVELGVVAWGIAGLGMGLAYPGTTLNALGEATSGQEGFASSALQVAEMVSVALGTGGIGALLALAAHLDLELAAGLSWGFGLSDGAALLALAASGRLSQQVGQPAEMMPARPGGPGG